MISSENELAELLEARKTTRFAKIIQQETDLHMTLILFGAALIMLVAGSMVRQYGGDNS